MRGQRQQLGWHLAHREPEFLLCESHSHYLGWWVGREQKPTGIQGLTHPEERKERKQRRRHPGHSHGPRPRRVEGGPAHLPWLGAG